MGLTTFWLTLVLLSLTFIEINGNRFNSTTPLKRNKRTLLWAGGGITKSVLGISIPVETKDKVNWRTMNLGVNFQAQFIPIPTIIYPWTRFERSMVHQKKQFQEHGTYVADFSRQFVYTAFELLMDRRGTNGRQCLLRAICEASQTPITHVGVFDEVLQLFLTPNESEIHTEYIDAKVAGRYGVDCLSLYNKCPHGYGLLDSISFFKS